MTDPRILTFSLRISLIPLPRFSFSWRRPSSRAALEAVIDDAKSHFAQESKRGLSVYRFEAAMRGSAWLGKTSGTRRPMSSVILPEGQGQMLIDDVRSFLDSKQWYRDRGIVRLLPFSSLWLALMYSIQPHHRGYLVRFISCLATPKGPDV